MDDDASDQASPQAPASPPAGGLEAAAVGLGRAWRGMGVVRSARTLARLNQEGGFDCPGCAWPEPDERSALEFCENGIKAVAHEATRRTIGAAFFAEWPIPRLAQQSDHWLEAQGRLAEPLWKPPGADHYQPIAWEEAFARTATAIHALDSPDQAVFYTSGRTSNEAAFLYQLFVRELGTNNLPDCSNMCHESSGTGLSEQIGVGKGTVGLPDFELADLILVIGQNPGTNHPRMLTELQRAKRRGCRIVAVNPLRERALVRFAHPKDPLSVLGRATPIADLFLQVRVGGDVALLKGWMKELLALEAARPGRVLDWDFLREHTEGFDALRDDLERTPWPEIERSSGIERSAIRRAAELYAEAERVIACWAMGLTQHRHGVANVQEVMNLLLLRGMVGKPGAGPCPVRGHSNVQGDRTMGIWERPKPEFLAALQREFGFAPPRRHGLDTVAAIEGLAAGRVGVFFGLGGNFAAATPDTAFTEQALRKARLTAHVATKLNRSHLVCGEEALLLPCLGRTERDVQAGGPQFVTVEDSMSLVHRSQGNLEPAAPGLRSEPAIVAGLARAVLGARSRVPWEDLVADYDRIRERIARVVPGFHEMNRRVRRPGGFVLPSGARSRHFETASGRARFRPHPLPRLELAPDQLLLMTVRSHDQFNTTVYGLDDRYRGVHGDRRVLFLHPADADARGLEEGARVDVTSHYAGARGPETRSVRGFRVRRFDLPRGCAAAYFPEANPLVPVASFAEGSRTPSYKSIPISVERARE
jgi:molybdopterin-dependent oxidoreductase alpha subunit